MPLCGVKKVSDDVPKDLLSEREIKKAKTPQSRCRRCCCCCCCLSMGCGTSSSKKVAMGKTEKKPQSEPDRARFHESVGGRRHHSDSQMSMMSMFAQFLLGSPRPKKSTAIKAAILIQRWYRKTNARLEARRRATWSIFQSIEYSGEQDQFKLYNFFNTMVEQFSSDGQQTAILKALREGDDKKHITGGVDRDRETDMVKLVADASRMSIPLAYDGPVLKFPITQSQVKALMQAFKSDKVMHPKYLLELLHHSRLHLMKLPNIHRVSTITAKQVTVCGDIHGQLNDLFVILHKNGLPSHENPYIFNGDFVDRGPHSVEVFTLLLVFMLDSFSKVYLNRGNHEDHSMNVRYGFTKEVMRKYKDSAAKLIKMYNEVFSYLPLATVIDQSVLVVHGGISEHVDLNLIDKIDRKKFISVLRPPSYDEALGKPKLPLKMKDLEEWQQIVDLLWSDPRQANGMVFNTFRGGGCYFGPDITEKVLNRHSLKMLIRSHQCKEDGFEYTHNNKVLTVFSASNYYEEDSNKGAYVKVMRPKPGTNEIPQCHVVQFIVQCDSTKKFSLPERVSYLEASALRNVRGRIIANRTALEAKFTGFDPKKTGIITNAQWFAAMESIMGFDVPWRLLKPKLVTASDNTGVFYNTTFKDKRLEFKKEDIGEPTVTESLYRHKEILETIFRTFDKDNTGTLSINAFTEACTVFVKMSNLSLQPTQIRDIAKSLDLNKDGNIDFNEFLEAFRIVDKPGTPLDKKE